MNLFVLDRDPVIAAQYNCNRHILKIILEAKQMLEMANPINKGPYYNNPVAKWVRECTGNYNWTATHAEALCNEYFKRYHRRHKIIIEHKNYNLPDKELTYFYQAVPDDCRSLDAIEGYRKYYLKYKMHFAKWKNGNIPPFVKEYYEYK